MNALHAAAMTDSHDGWYVLVAGFGGSGLFLTLAAIATIRSKTSSNHKTLLLIDGADGRLSTSKAQWFAWTVVIVGSYVAIFTARALTGHANALPQVPGNVLIALGFSATTMATAKGITTAYSAGGRVSKSPPPSAANAQTVDQPGGLLSDDSGITDLSKVQLLTWTTIALVIYVYLLGHQVDLILNHAHGSGSLGLPDIDTTLMVLTGLSSGGYLGKKLVQTNQLTPTLTSLVPSKLAGNQQLTIFGSSFGLGSEDSSVTIDGRVVPLNSLISWSDAKIVIRIPNAALGGGAWDPSKTLPVGVIVEGTPTTTTLALVISPPA